MNFLTVDDLFFSVQGENPTIGKPSIFLRLANCNLKCAWKDFSGGHFNCDTDAQTDPNKYVSVHSEDMTFKQIEYKISELLSQCVSYMPSLVITGGEPLIQQKQILKFIQEQTLGFEWFEIETNGTIIPDYDLMDIITQFNISPKLESSGNSLKMRERPNAYKNYIEWHHKGKRIFFKFVVVSKEDLHEIQELQEKYHIPSDIIYLMPEGTTRDVICDRKPWIIDMCKKYGYNATTRLQVLAYGNKRST